MASEEGRAALRLRRSHQDRNRGAWRTMCRKSRKRQFNRRCGQIVRFRADFSRFRGDNRLALRIRTRTRRARAFKLAIAASTGHPAGCPLFSPRCDLGEGFVLFCGEWRTASLSCLTLPATGGEHESCREAGCGRDAVCLRQHRRLDTRTPEKDILCRFSSATTTSTRR
jgi:hypothetical protein